MAAIEVVLPFQIDFVWYRRADQRFEYIMQDAVGQAVDNTGYTIIMEVRHPSGAVLITRSTSNGGVVLGGPSGWVTILTPYTLLTGLAEATYTHDILEEPPSGDRGLIFCGEIQVKP